LEKKESRQQKSTDFLLNKKPTKLLPLERSIVTCTGIDTYEELCSKYKDAEFLLGSIRKLERDHDDSAKISHSVHSVIPSPSLPSPITECRRQRLEDSYDDDEQEEENEDNMHTGNVVNMSSYHPKLSISIHHGINAVFQSTSSSSSPQTSLQPHKHVIFNHPHLGTEDASKHTRFLSHIFHSAAHHWLQRPNGLLYITLVKGQCERWNCIDSAFKHGLVLCHRGDFHPPISPGAFLDHMGALELLQREDGAEIKWNEHETRILSKDNKRKKRRKEKEKEDLFQTRYNFRRHQNGRSFASRAQQGSETLIFTRSDNTDVMTSKSNQKNDTFDIHNDNSDEIRKLNSFDNSHFQCKLFWQSIPVKNSPSSSMSTTTSKPFPCTKCPKTFIDQRALKNHFKNVHMDSEIHLPNQIQCTPPSFFCTDCERSFSNAQALADHRRAKHFLHRDIKPDWYFVDSNKRIHETTTSTNKNEISNTSKEPKYDEDPTHAKKEVDESDNLNINYFPMISSTHSSSCSICGLVFSSEKERMDHDIEFIPNHEISEKRGRNIVDNNSTCSDGYKIFECIYCKKNLRDRRALLQHENFCSTKITKSANIPCTISNS